MALILHICIDMCHILIFLDQKEAFRKMKNKNIFFVELVKVTDNGVVAILSVKKLIVEHLEVVTYQMDGWRDPGKIYTWRRTPTQWMAGGIQVRYTPGGGHLPLMTGGIQNV